MAATIYAFVKILDRQEYVKPLVGGMLHMRPLRLFRNYRDEEGGLRGDPYEGIVAWLQPERTLVKVGEHIIPSRDIAEPIAVQSDEQLRRNAFCLYSLNSSGHDSVSAETLAGFKNTLAIHRNCYGFGGYCVAFLNAQEFIDRVTRALQEAKLAGALGLVEYFDERTFHGWFDKKKLGFVKRGRYSIQREYRVLLDAQCSRTAPWDLGVGNLSDIAWIGTPEEFNSKLSIRLPNGSVA
jgi:hypothetical protein